MQEEENVEETQLEQEQAQEELKPLEEVSEEQEQPSHVSYRDDGVIVVDMDMANQQVAQTEEQQVETAVETNEVIEEPSQPLQEVVEEQVSTEEKIEELAQEAVEAINESESTGTELPENIQKLVSFMDETGGSLEDYVNLNKDYSSLDNLTALSEYYKMTKPHLDNEEINFLIEDSFNYDEEVDDETEIKRKKLALKEQVANAKAYLDGQKSKYYDEVKARPTVNNEYQKAMDFFNRYNKESEISKAKIQKNKAKFDKKTNEVFNQQFEGFDFNVGDKNYKFKINDVEKVKTQQSDINNFLGKFLAEDKSLDKANEYHKSIFTAMNADAIAKHFYEQGKADAIKDTVKKSKNIDMAPRTAQKEFGTDGIKVRILGDNSSDFKFKIKNKK